VDTHNIAKGKAIALTLTPAGGTGRRYKGRNAKGKAYANSTSRNAKGRAYANCRRGVPLQVNGV
jgi:hypothetical protein